MSAQRRRAYRRSSHDPPPDVRGLLGWAGLRVVDVERRAGLAPGSFQRVLAGRRGRRMGLPTAEKRARYSAVLRCALRFCRPIFERLYRSAPRRLRAKPFAERS